MTATTNNKNIFVIEQCEGYKHTEEVMVHVQVDSLSHHKNLNHFVIYIPGDLQLKRSEMMSSTDDDCAQWAHESYEDTIEQSLAVKYPQDHSVICIIRPNVVVDTISYFDHFFEAGRACMHLLALVESVKREIVNRYGMTNVEFTDVTFEILAFSKGCIVLNTLLAEMASVYQWKRYHKRELLHWETLKARQLVDPFYHVYLMNETKSTVHEFIENSDQILAFSQSIIACHWLDAHRFISDETVIQMLNELFEKRSDSQFFFLHATPLLLEQGRYRGHVRPENNNFCKHCKLTKFRMYLEEKPFTFQIHFDVLREFLIRW